MPDYRICGLSVRSELDLPGAIPNDAAGAGPDVTIRRSSATRPLQSVTARGPDWEMTGDVFRFRVPDLADFEIARGREIVVDLEQNASERDAAGFILGTAFGVLLHQRGALVLHGAAVARSERAIAICGASGAGKSTLAAALCREGCSFVADDLCVVDFDESRRPVALPDGRRLKLWRESVINLDLAHRRGEVVRQSFDKYFVDPFATAAAPPLLRAIYVLREAASPDRPKFEKLALPDAMRIVETEAYRPGLGEAMGRKPELFAKAAAIFGHIDAFLLVRPRGFDSMADTVAALVAHWDALG